MAAPDVREGRHMLSLTSGDRVIIQQKVRETRASDGGDKVPRGEYLCRVGVGLLLNSQALPFRTTCVCIVCR